VAVNLLIEHFKMSVYYYFFIITKQKPKAAVVVALQKKIAIKYFEFGCCYDVYVWVFAVYCSH